MIPNSSANDTVLLKGDLFMKKGTKTVITVTALIIVAISWWLISPLFLNETVDEALPPTTVETAVEENQESSETMEETPSQMDVAGVFMNGDKNYETSGKISSIETEDGTYLRFEDFETTNGPDLFVYLTKPGMETSEGIRLGELKGNTGNQNYLVPADVDLSEYNTVVIWCRAFSTMFGTGELTASN